MQFLCDTAEGTGRSENGFEIAEADLRIRGPGDLLGTVQSGLPHEVAKVLRDMHRLKFDKDLSFGERHLLDRAKSLLMKELAFAKKMTEEKLAEEVAGIFRV